MLPGGNWKAEVGVEKANKLNTKMNKSKPSCDNQKLVYFTGTAKLTDAKARATQQTY